MVDYPITHHEEDQGHQDTQPRQHNNDDGDPFANWVQCTAAIQYRVQVARVDVITNCIASNLDSLHCFQVVCVTRNHILPVVGNVVDLVFQGVLIIEFKSQLIIQEYWVGRCLLCTTYLRLWSEWVVLLRLECRCNQVVKARSIRIRSRGQCEANDRLRCSGVISCVVSTTNVYRVFIIIVTGRAYYANWAIRAGWYTDTRGTLPVVRWACRGTHPLVISRAVIPYS